MADHQRVDHSKEFVRDDGVHTNLAESFFGRMRQAHWGAWHRMTAEWIGYYAAEMAWRQEMVGRSNLQQLRDLLPKLMTGRPSGRLRDYWRKSEAGKAYPVGKSDALFEFVQQDSVRKKAGRPKKTASKGTAASAG